jgi:cytochrome d ubiquinol oxidase subunit II
VNVAAFVIVAFMISVYVLLDGYDLGVAAITPFVARNERERLASMRSIGPFWNGNEVWLIAAGAVLFALFPQAYASSFSGFYLPFIVVLWLLMARGIAMELREHYPSAMWHGFWDVCFAAASGLLIVIFGVALGNLIRGLPLDAHGYFLGTFGFLLNWYALLVGFFSVAALAQHGAAFLIMRVAGLPAERAKTALPRLWAATFLLFAVVTVATFFVHQHIAAWVKIVGLISFVWLLGLRVAIASRRERVTFAVSCAFLATLLVSVSGTLYPFVISGYPAGHGGLSIVDAAASPIALTSAIAVTVVGLTVVVIYSVFMWKKLGGKIAVEDPNRTVPAEK